MFVYKVCYHSDFCVDEQVHTVPWDEWGQICLVNVFILYFIPDFIILRFFMYLIDMRNHAKEKNLRMLLGWLLMFWRKKINFGHLCFSDPACVERTKYCKTLTKIVLSSNESDREALAPQQPLQPFEVLEDGSFSCSYCGKNYKLIGSLKKHLEKNHAILNAIVFKCETCGKTFETKCQETRHMKSHWFLSPSSNQCHLNGINI